MFVDIVELIIDLNVFDGISPEIIEQYVVFAFKEILAVEHEIVDEFTVDIDSAVAMQFDTWKLLYKGVEHAAFRQDKSVGIIHNSVAVVIELHF